MSFLAIKEREGPKARHDDITASPAASTRVRQLNQKERQTVIYSASKWLKVSVPDAQNAFYFCSTFYSG